MSALAARSSGLLTTVMHGAFERKRELDRQARQAAAASRAAQWSMYLTLFLVKSIRDQAAEASRRADEARRLAGSHVARFTFDGSSASLVSLWDTVVTTGLEVMRSQRIWDVTSQSGVNQRRERSSATTSVTRTPVQCGEGRPGFLESDRRVLRFGNANGHPMYLFPTFLQVGDDPAGCVLLDLREVAVKLEFSRFQEREKVPSDASVVGHTWLYSNKDGGRDKRFKDNYQIPVVRYAEILFSSTSGLDECYMFSNAAAAERFAAALQALSEQLRRMEDRVCEGAEEPAKGGTATPPSATSATTAPSVAVPSVESAPQAPRGGPPLPGKVGSGGPQSPPPGGGLPRPGGRPAPGGAPGPPPAPAS
ncbi:MAG: hypothetical protein ACO3JL_21820, partial [Myxococcota bacterium]